MKASTATALWLLLAAPGAWARLGETPAQIEQRYGAHAESKSDPDSAFMARTYHPEGYDIEVVFLNGESQAEIFSKPSRAIWSIPERQVLLSANSFGGNWRKTFNYDFDSVWMLGDVAVAIYSIKGQLPTFTIMTQTFASRPPAWIRERLQGL